MNRQTFTYATHQIPLECDVYSSTEYPPDTPVFLFFHSGGLVGGARGCVPPWLVQTCIQRKWPLISPSYRLLPQSGSVGLLQDVTAAYEFARNWGQGGKRNVIVGGASAGFFCAAMTAHHLQPRPLALLSITGIPTFRHPFFNSSTLLVPELPTEAQVKTCFDEPVSVGTKPEEDPTVFYLGSLTESGAKETAYEHPSLARGASDTGNYSLRDGLYDYFVYKNAYGPMLESVDPGYAWAQTDSQDLRLAHWPITILIHGNNDPDVDINVVMQTAKDLGPVKARLFVAEGQPHLFEATYFLEDHGVGMDTVRRAVRELDEVLSLDHSH